MKKILLLIFIMTGTVFNYSCKKDEIPFFDDARYLYIDSEDADGNPVTDFPFSFVTSPTDEALLPIPLKFSGRELSEDASYSITIDPSSTIADGEYDIPATVFRKLYPFQDTLYVKLIKSDRMEDEILTLTINLTSNDNFRAMQTGRTQAKITVSNIISQPSWWNAEVIEFYLGEYSDQKLRLFVLYGYAGDYGALPDDEKRHYARKFKYAIEEHAGDPEWDGISVPIPG